MRSSRRRPTTCLASSWIASKVAPCLPIRSAMSASSPSRMSTYIRPPCSDGSAIASISILVSSSSTKSATASACSSMSISSSRRSATVDLLLSGLLLRAQPVPGLGTLHRFAGVAVARAVRRSILGRRGDLRLLRRLLRRLSRLLLRLRLALTALRLPLTTLRLALRGLGRRRLGLAAVASLLLREVLRLLRGLGLLVHPAHEAPLLGSALFLAAALLRLGALEGGRAVV